MFSRLGKVTIFWILKYNELIGLKSRDYYVIVGLSKLQAKELSSDQFQGMELLGTTWGGWWNSGKRTESKVTPWPCGYMTVTSGNHSEKHFTESLVSVCAFMSHTPWRNSDKSHAFLWGREGHATLIDCPNKIASFEGLHVSIRCVSRGLKIPRLGSTCKTPSQTFTRASLPGGRPH